MQKKYILTPEGFAKLKGELEHLRTIRRQELAEKMRHARDDIRPTEGVEYVETRKEWEFVERRITTLEKALAHAVISIPDRHNPIVEFGDRVTVHNQEGKKEVFTIVGSAEADPKQGRISNESPVGQGLLGKRVGDNVEVKVPAGVVKFTIIKIG